jgi:hypothetical protein
MLALFFLLYEAPWSAVAAATAFRLCFIRQSRNRGKEKGGSCCYRTPRCLRHSGFAKQSSAVAPRMVVPSDCAEQSSAVVASPWIRGYRFAELRSAQSDPQECGESSREGTGQGKPRPFATRWLPPAPSPLGADILSVMWVP